MAPWPRPRDVIGLDLGTPSCKAISFELDGQVLRRSRNTYETVREPSGGVRQRPEDWWSAVLASLAGASVPQKRCQGLAIAGQIGTYLAVDSAFEPLKKASVMAALARPKAHIGSAPENAPDEAP